MELRKEKKCRFVNDFLITVVVCNIRCTCRTGAMQKKVFIATMHNGHVFRIQCPDDGCKNLGEYMTNSISVKDTRSN